MPTFRKSLYPALRANDNRAIVAHLGAFKERGVVRHDRTLQIPSADRIPALTRSDEGYDYILTLLTARLKRTFSNMNLKRGVNDDQLLNIAERIIEESHEDNLSVEDVLLYLEKLEVGKMGQLFERMDMPTFFEHFEFYRQERHLALNYMQYELECQYKGLGDTTRISDGRAENDANTRQVMADYYKQHTNAQSDTVPQAPAP